MAASKNHASEPLNALNLGESNLSKVNLKPNLSTDLNLNALNTAKGFVLLLSGPSGAGKTSLLKELLSEFKDELYFSISCTTRAPRTGEKDGVNYHFISENEFQKGIEKGDFLEYAKVHDHFYGTALSPCLKALEAGKVVVFDIDVQGFYIAKDKLKDSLVSIFVTTKDKKELEKRLLARDSDSKESIKTRLDNAEKELAAVKDYDYLIINEDLKQAYSELRAIYIAQKLRVAKSDLNALQIQWKGL